MHWEDLRNRSVDDILDREGVTLAADSQGYEVSFLNTVCLVDAQKEKITELTPNPDRCLTEMFQILLIRYLVAPNGGPIDGKDVSEKDFQGGVTFFQGPHALFVSPIEKLFGDDPDAFEARCHELGGVPYDFGDKAMRFFPFPEMPVTYVLWKADDEFPASVSVMFDSSLSRWFELDMIFSLVWVLTERIVGRQYA
jgi:hypothetical protein